MVLLNFVVAPLQNFHKMLVKRVANKRKVTDKGEGSKSRSAQPVFVLVHAEQLYKTYISSRSVEKE